MPKKLVETIKVTPKPKIRTINLEPCTKEFSPEELNKKILSPRPLITHKQTKYDYSLSKKTQSTRKNKRISCNIL